MKAIMVMYDSLKRSMLSSYGCEWVYTPNFKRLSEKAVTFDCSYIGSMPCMPARRELHTGRYNFLHRSWGPLEPFDDSMPQILRENGIHTHLASDHYHYWEDGGGTYHNRYSTWEASRGQEGDPWIGDLNPPSSRPNRQREGKVSDQDCVNRQYMRKEDAHPQAKTFKNGLGFIERNHNQDNWFLHIETFDPHEPYFVHDKYKDMYDFDFSRFEIDWPSYRHIGEEDRELSEHILYTNAALTTMCDNYLGKVLDAMDKYDLWKDTMLIVNTDHGFLIGEHDFWGKSGIPYYDDIARTPLFIWDPRSRVQGQRRKSLVQTIDLAPTLLDYFRIAPTEDMQGIPLEECVKNDTPVREAGIFGMFGAHVNCSDGRYVYMKAPATEDNCPLFEYTLMPTHAKYMFNTEELQDIQLQEPFPFTKNCRTMKIKGRDNKRTHNFETLLFDTEKDPVQKFPLKDDKIEARMKKLMTEAMKKNDAPVEQFVRLGLN